MDNSSAPVAIVVDPYSSGAFYAPAFHKLGVRTIAVVSSPEPPEVYAGSYRPDDFEQVFIVGKNSIEENDTDEIVRSLKSLNPICIVTGCESGVELSEALTPQVLPQKCNIPGLASARRHKGDMGAAIASHGLPFIKQICSNSEAEVREWLVTHKLEDSDLVIKPPKSASTDGVTRVPKAKNWQSVFQDLLGTTNRLGIVNRDLVVQQYVTGVEYVIDTFSYQGIHTVCDICQYSKIDNGEYMAVYDKMEWISNDASVCESLTAYAKGVLDAVGLKFGAAHIEVMLTEDGPLLIEIGARPHGGGHPQFCRLATGDSQIDRAVRYFSKNAEVPEGYSLQKHVQIVFLISRNHGYVKNTEVFEQLKSIPSFYSSFINVSNGDYIQKTKDLFGTLDLGFVVLASTDKHQINIDYQAVRSLENCLELAS